MLLMVEKGIRGGICHTSHMQKLMINIWKIMIKIKNRHILKIEMFTWFNLCGWEMLWKLPVNNFEWIEDEGYLLEGNAQHPEKLHELHNDLPFSPERIKMKKLKSLLLICMIKVNTFLA